MKMILNYSKYSWIAWLVIKCLMALELGIITWISNCGFLFNNLINIMVLRVSRLIFFFLPLTQPCWDIWEVFYSKHTFDVYFLSILDIAGGPVEIMKDSVNYLYLTDARIDIGLLIFFMFVCGDITHVVCELKIRNMYRDVRKDLERRVYKKDYKNLNYLKWKQFNSDEEIENYLDVREQVMEFFRENDISSYSVVFDDSKIRKHIQSIIKEEIIKIKPNIKQKEILKIKHSGKKNKPNKSKNNSIAIQMESRKSNRKSNPNESKVKSPPVTAYDTISLVARVQSSITGIDICWVCGEDSCLRCSGCKKALYCGEACYRSDWEKHGEWCKWRREILKMTKRNQRLETRVKEEVD